jgi:hypothetical protein
LSKGSNQKGGGLIMKKFLGSWRIYLITLFIPILHAALGRPCGTWKRPESCESFKEYLDAMILDVKLHNLSVIFSFILSIFLLSSVRHFVKGNKRLGIRFLFLAIMPVVIAVILFPYKSNRNPFNKTGKIFDKLVDELAKGKAIDKILRGE